MRNLFLICSISIFILSGCSKNIAHRHIEVEWETDSFLLEKEVDSIMKLPQLELFHIYVVRKDTITIVRGIE